MSNSIHTSHKEFSRAAGRGQESYEKPTSIAEMFPTRGPAEEWTEHPWDPFEPLEHRRCHPPPPVLPTRHGFSSDLQQQTHAEGQSTGCLQPAGTPSSLRG